MSAVGNRTAYNLTTPLDGTAVTTYTYDAANRLLVAGAPGHSVAYTWDARGNLLADSTFTYTYSAAGRMVRAANLDNTIVYTYTADGLRVQQAVGGLTTSYTWDWATGVPELLSDGESLYLIGYDTLGWQSGDDWTFVLPDALGSVRQETDDVGTVTAIREWLPYGEEIGEMQNGLGFTGEWNDANVGLMYLRARWLNVSAGRFTQQDLWNGMYTRPQSLNKWAYVVGNPIKYTDPSGRVPTRNDILEGHAEYSCNCGWIDWDHALGGHYLMTQLLYDMGEAANYDGNYAVPGPQDSNFDPWSPLYDPDIDDSRLLDKWLFDVWMAISPTPYPVSVSAVVPDSGLDSQSHRVDLALSILMELEERLERAQGSLGSATSSFSEEDLVSDLLGFYRSISGASEQTVRDKCGAVGTVGSLRVYEDVYSGSDVWSLLLLGNTGGFVTGWKHWSPRLLPWRDSCRYNGCCLIYQLCQYPGSGVWPSEFSGLVARRIGPNPGGQWWEYRGSTEDGFPAVLGQKYVRRLYRP